MIWVLVSKRERWQVPDVLNARPAAHEFTREGHTVRVAFGGAVRQDGEVALALMVNVSQNERFRAFLPRFFTRARVLSSLRLEDRGGQKFRLGREISSNPDGTFTVRVPLVPPLWRTDSKKRTAPRFKAPLKLVLDMPVEWVQTQVPFSFSNVPLP